MPECCVVTCKNSSRNKNYKNNGITYHMFPSDPFRCAKWISIVAKEREEELYRPYKNSTICSIHFDKFDITGNRQRTRLLKTANPKLQAHNLPEASTSTAAAARNLPKAEESSTSLNLNSDDEPTEQDAGDSGEPEHYTSSTESQKGRLWLSGGAGNVGSLLPETPAHSLQQELLMDLHEISDKIQNFYPDALGKQFTLTFKGEDGDKSEYIFTSASETRRNSEKHRGLSCDECGSDIIGFRYKCVSCEDYDLCSACEALGTHADHIMMRITKPIKLKQARSLLQRWCEAMKTAGVTTIEEITGSPDSAESNAGPAMPVGPINTKPVVITPKTSKEKETKQKKESMQPPKIKVEAKKRKMPEGESGAIKKKIEESTATKETIASEGDRTIEITIKEEPLENTNLADYYSSFAETEPAVHVDQVKVEDQDPLGADDVKTDEMENYTSLGPSGRIVVDTSLGLSGRMVVGTSLAPPGQMVVGTSLAPSGLMAVKTSLAPPGRMTLGTSLAPPGPMAVSTSLAPLGGMAVSTSSAPPGQMVVNTSLAPPGRMAVGTSLAPSRWMVLDTSLTTPGQLLVSTSLAPPGQMAVGTSLAPPGHMAVGTSLAPPGQVVADTSKAPPGPEPTGVSMQTYTHKAAR